jgi:aminotransferase class I and II
MGLPSHSTSTPGQSPKREGPNSAGTQDSVPTMLAEYRKRRDFVVGRLRQISGVSIVMPKGAFYAYPNISVAYQSGKVKNSLDFANQLLNASHAAVGHGEAFSAFTNSVRLSAAPVKLKRLRSSPPKSACHWCLYKPSRMLGTRTCTTSRCLRCRDPEIRRMTQLPG